GQNRSHGALRASLGGQVERSTLECGWSDARPRHGAAGVADSVGGAAWGAGHHHPAGHSAAEHPTVAGNGEAAPGLLDWARLRAGTTVAIWWAVSRALVRSTSFDTCAALVSSVFYIKRCLVFQHQ